MSWSSYQSRFQVSLIRFCGQWCQEACSKQRQTNGLSNFLSFSEICTNGHRRASLTQHSRCTVCQMSFASAEALKSHVSQLHGTNMEQRSPANKDMLIIRCPHCKDEFSSMRGLNCHMRYHRSGELTIWSIVVSLQPLGWYFAPPNYIQTSTSSIRLRLVAPALVTTELVMSEGLQS